MNTITEKLYHGMLFGLMPAICFAVTASAQKTALSQASTNRLETGGQYEIQSPPSNMMFQITDNPENSGDDNLVWSNNGRMIAVDRMDPDASQKYICILDVRNLDNVQVLGARSSAVTNPVFANITSWTWNDDRVLFGWMPQVQGQPSGKCRLMSCAATGDVNVAPFLVADPRQNPSNHVYSPSVLYDHAVGKERLLFLVSSSQNDSPTDPGPGGRINLYSVAYESGGAPRWNERVQLTDFNTNLSIISVKWCPELGTNYHPLCDRLEILLTMPPAPPAPVKQDLPAEDSRIIIFNNVRAVMEGAAPPPATLADPRLVQLETNMTMNSQVSWTFDGQYVMYGRTGTNPPATDLYSKRADNPLNEAVKFEVPESITGGQKQWLSISPDGMKAAFTVNHKVYVIPLQFDNVAVTGAFVTNVLTDASYTAVDISGDAINSNTTFSIVAPPSVDTNNFNGEFSGFAREFTVEGVASQFNLTTNATMTLHFSEADIPDGVSATNLAVYVYNPAGSDGQTGTWDKLDSAVDTNNMTIACQVEHFSVYTIGRASAEPAPDPVGPVIKANGAAGTLTVAYPAPVTITVQMNPDIYNGIPVDWWAVAYGASIGWYYLGAIQWTPFSGDLGLCRPAYQGALFSLSAMPVLSNMTLPRGTYYFWFAVDYPMDGVLNLEGPILCDVVTIIVQ